MAGGDGILSGPIDLDGPRRPKTIYPSVEAVPGLVVTQRGTPFTGRVIEARGDRMTIRDERTGREHICRLTPGGFVVDGRPVTLVPPVAKPVDRAAERTASGSLAVPGAGARVARASRILVEGAHDAELVERVWGDDLRVEGVVVEPLDGADNLPEVVRSFGPRPGRRLGILLDHLVLGSKEQRLAATARSPRRARHRPPVRRRVAGDQAGGRRDRAAGPTSRWASPGRRACCAALGIQTTPARFWKHLLGQVTSWTDLEPELIGAVERLIDFVTEPAPD